ncbi:putative WD and tetratricopeptide repeats protein 1 [Cocos nucifera]|nr:putative WD and tetratricopeptide repeats protein 1 [Cocos nucifera]
MINIWSYNNRRLLHSVETGHSANIFCTKFVPETSDELVVSGAGDTEVRLFNISRLNGKRSEEIALEPAALYRCHSRRVKKLAVEVGNPNVVWSASEDGTVRQHDFRESGSCPPARSANQQCRNVLVHLSCQANAGKELSFSTLKGFIFSVINSANGPIDLLALLKDGQSSMRYAADDVPKQLCIAPLFKETKVPSPPAVSSNNLPERKYDLCRVGKLDMCKKLVQLAAKALDEGLNLFYGIEACNEVLDGKGPEIGLALQHECLCIRSALLLKRKWKNDVHMAIRDCNKARLIDASSFKAYYCMSEALLQLGKNKEALEYAEAAHNLAPSNSDAAEMVKRIKDRLAAAEAEKSKKDNEDTGKSEARHGRLRSLSDVLFQSELSSPSQEDWYNREDSDYEEEMELDFETSISGDEGRDNEPSILRGSLNLRFHRRDESARENCSTESTDGSHGSPSSSSQHENSSYQPEVVIDMKQRFVGHCNVGTDIKQASFLGQQGEYVASGSDDGRWFIWEKRTGRLIKMLVGDEAVVNCVQCHPFDCAIATSGIDDTIKVIMINRNLQWVLLAGDSNSRYLQMWTPHAEVPSMVAGGTAGPETADVLSAIENNQRKLCRNREAMLSVPCLSGGVGNHTKAYCTIPIRCEQTQILYGFAIYFKDVYRLSEYSRVLAICGPGNNGGDGLVAARHLYHFGYKPFVCYPKRTPKPLYTGLVTQLESLSIPFLSVEDLPQNLSDDFDLIVDAMFGFSFHGQPRPPFDVLIQGLASLSGIENGFKRKLAIISVDVPSGWHVEEGDINGEGIKPDMLVSLTAPKLCAKKFTGPHHFLGGRFVPPSIVNKYRLNLPPYPGTSMCVRIGKSPSVDISSLRENYISPELLEDQVMADPVDQFHKWFDEAVAAGLQEPNAMALSTSAMPCAEVLL